MKTNELIDQILGIRNLHNANELRLYRVLVKKDNQTLPFTGISEDKANNRVFVYANRSRNEVNLFNLLVRLKKCGMTRDLFFTKGYNLTTVKSIYIDSRHYEITLITF